MEPATLPDSSARMLFRFLVLTLILSVPPSWAAAQAPGPPTRVFQVAVDEPVPVSGPPGGRTAGVETRPAPEALARSLQQRYEGVRDFSAEFVHTYRGGVLRKQATERGTVAIKKPGRMRWSYTTPEKKMFVSDGRKLYSYIPQDRQVIVSNVPAEDEATTPVLFLAGKGDIARDFTASYVDPATGPGMWTLKLVPRRAEREYDWLVVVVDQKTLQIRALTTRDRQGGESTLTFSKMKENQGLSDKEFAFRIPRGVDVITDGTSL